MKITLKKDARLKMVLKKAKVVLNDFEWRWLFWLGKLLLTSPNLLFDLPQERRHSLVSWEPESWGKLTIAYAKNLLSLLGLLLLWNGWNAIMQREWKDKMFNFFPCSFNFVHVHCKQSIEIDNNMKDILCLRLSATKKIPRS